jgi:hypothetical protein
MALAREALLRGADVPLPQALELEERLAVRAALAKAKG